MIRFDSSLVLDTLYHATVDTLSVVFNNNHHVLSKLYANTKPCGLCLHGIIEHIHHNRIQLFFTQGDSDRLWWYIECYFNMGVDKLPIIDDFGQ